MEIFDHDHEQVVFCHDKASGLRAIIAVYSTELGPALGGTRFYPYASEQAALADVLNLSTAMAYKAALAGFDLGGGKAVIIGDPDTDKSEALLRAYGTFIQSLNGRYITTCDVGTFSTDMDVIGRSCDFVTGRTVANGGAGDSSILTAFGVYQGMRAAAHHLWDSPSLEGRTVGIVGVGKVGSKLARHLCEAGANVVITDVKPAAVAAVTDALPHVQVADNAAAIATLPGLDIYAPCALGGALDDETVAALAAPIVCGAANNQLVHDGTEQRLLEQDIVYAPDFCVNAGGLIQMADELNGFDMDRARNRTAGIYYTTLAVLKRATTDSVSPSVAANSLAEQRMREIGRLRKFWLDSTV